MKKSFSLLLIIMLSTVFFAGCKKDKGEPPSLPPKESMSIDFSNFISNKKSLEVVSGQKGTNTTNWDYAALVAGGWNDILTAYLVIPVSAFKLAFEQSPSFVSTKTWQWSYSASVASVTYKARLVGAINTSDVEWKMYITREGTGGFAEFLWFEGTSKLDGTQGQWILYQSPLVTDQLLQVDWTKTSTEISSIKYTYLKDTSFKGSYISYGLTSNILNAYYTVHYYDFNTTQFSDVNIEWNTTANNGRVKSSNYLLGDWYCWDINKLNATCQ
jgi:hypothetical protein